VHRLSASFVLGHHGCDRQAGERLLKNQKFRLSQNDYDWLGEGVYFWEANPLRGLQFAHEVRRRDSQRIKAPFVIGAILDLGSYEALAKSYAAAGAPLPRNRPDQFRHPLDCAVINYLHKIRADHGQFPVDSVKGVFQEPPQLYPGSAFMQKNHIQIAIRNPACIKGVFRVPKEQLDPNFEFS
jgi:hypothetical protein